MGGGLRVPSNFQTTENDIHVFCIRLTHYYRRFISYGRPTSQPFFIKKPFVA